jgi:hypothetical protein
MGRKLVTISTHLDPMEAAMARNKLDAGGIRAEILDEETATTAWQLAGAIHGAKLLVAEADADCALRVLAGEEDGPEEPGTGFTAEPPLPDADDEPLNKREETAERAFRAALLGLVAWPLQIWATILLWGAWSSEEPLRPRPRSSLKWATGINLAFVLAILALLAARFASAALDT